MTRIPLTALLLALLAGCAQLPFTESKGEQALATGVKQYEEGNYKESQKNLQAALDAGLDATGQRVRAHKYLAFIHCAGGREKPCRDEFRKALAADPAFDLTPAEAGHPLWGPVFRSVKAESARKR